MIRRFRWTWILTVCLGAAPPASGQNLSQRQLATHLPKSADQQRKAGEIEQQRIAARNGDWEKLGRLIRLPVILEVDRARWSAEFLRMYWKLLETEPAKARDLLNHVEPGFVQNALKRLAESAPDEPLSTVERAKPNTAISTRRPTATAGRVVAGKAGIQWVSIPGGTFTMGSNDVPYAPPHRVTMKPFQMAKTLVTNKQYKACVDAGVCRAAKRYGRNVAGDDQPVLGVSWYDAKTFSEWVGGRLPSEAQWEYAARSAGKDQKYPWGNEEPTCERAAVLGCSSVSATLPVCSRPLGNTEQGLCDMAGNAWEWVQDWSHPSYEGAPADGSAWESPKGSFRIARGGAWCNAGVSLPHASHRRGGDPTFRASCMSFRPVR